MSYRLCSPVLLGLEGICADELKRKGFENVAAENGRVLFSGDIYEAARANLWLRTGERVLILVAEFEARNFDTLFEGVKAAPWEEFIPRTGAFPVKGHSVRSALSSIPDCQTIIKKAVAVRLGQKYGLEILPETGGKYQISFNILNNICSVYIDTTGESLHKRGYRAESNLAPIRETLAAAMVYLSGRRGDRPLCDPMCGSGTILIEAALTASNTAPGLYRSFALESFAGFDKKRLAGLREQARAEIRPFEGPITGSDIDENAIKIAVSNAKKAGVGDKISFIRAPLAEAEIPDIGALITNPPYGERMGDVKAARELYRLLGERTHKKTLGAYVISPDEEFERYFGRRADKKRKLYNGMIKCNLYMYR